MVQAVALLCLVIGLVGCPSGPAEVASTEVAEGKRLYDKYCALCHAADGKGYAADNASQLANQSFLATVSNRLLFSAIEQGRPDTAMAAYGAALGGPLGYGEINKIIGYLRTLQKVPAIDVSKVAVSGDAVRGEKLFAERCASCHGEKARGGTAMSLDRTLFLMNASDGFLQHAISHGRSGTPMPAFKDVLDPEQIGDLTRYIRSLARNIPLAPIAGEVPPTFDNIIIHPDGPAPQFSELREGRYVPASEVNEAYKKGARMVILDARVESDWRKAHIPGALPVPYYDSKRMLDELPRDGTWILTYCACPHAASGRVMDEQRAAGFRKTAVIDEGILIWIRRGYAIVHGATE